MSKPDVTFNAIVIVQSMHAKDCAGEELCQLINRKSDRILGGRIASVFNIFNQVEFQGFLASMKWQVKSSGLKPLIHFEMHGTEEGLLLNSGETILWKNLETYLRDLNIRLRNNLFVSVSTCYGGCLLDVYNLQLPCSFYGYIGPMGEVSMRGLNSCFIEFYDALFDTGSITEAIISMKIRLPEYANKFVYLNFEKYWQFIIQEQLRLDKDPEYRQHHLNRMTSLYKPRFPHMTVDEFQKHLSMSMDKADFESQFDAWRKIFFHQDLIIDQYIKD